MFSRLCFGSPSSSSSQHEVKAPVMRGVMMGPDELASRRREKDQASNRAISTLIRDFRDRLRFRPQRDPADDDTSQLSQAEEIRWLKKRLQLDFPVDEANELVAILEHLPLPTAQLAQTQPGRPAKPDPVLSVFLRNLRNEETMIDLESDQQDSQRKITKALVSLIQISFIEVERLNPAAIRLLCFMSIFNNKAIPDILLKSFLAKEPVPQPPQVQTPKPRRSANPFRYLRSGHRNNTAITTNGPKSSDDSLDMLLEYSFITEDAGGDKYTMNKFVQQAVKNWIEAHSETKYWHRRAVEVLHQVFHTNRASLLGNFPALIPHVHAVILDLPVPEMLYITCDKGEDRDYLLTRVSVLNEFTSECTEVGLLELAGRAISEAADINARLFPPHRSSTLWTQSRYGHVLNAQRNITDGKLAEAERTLREAVDSVDLNSDERHALPALLTSLGESLYQQSKYEEAHEVFERALKDSRETVGTSHSRTLNCLRNLAVNHIARGNYQTAEDLQLRVVEAKVRTLGAEHPETLVAKSDLGRVFHAHEKYAESEKMQRDVSKLLTSTLGAAHAWNLLSLYRLATTLNLQGKNEEALTLNTFVLEERKKMYKQDTHQALVATIKQQAYILRDLKWYGEAAKVFLRSKESHVNALGTGHYRTASIIAEYEAILKLGDGESNEKNGETKAGEQSSGSFNEKSPDLFGVD
ncbi:TPR-like protein [Mytilinidion resinicola]|uniref:TPR-like protein n=1 Tax=Mytilinidion resinicola TaxID=574789 RepID=A0A6A6Y8I5_9PEZI|nr:TPR-like protein [Mytilinidion resinicola]KAF2804274.1 TPR-like protein [Mytilinidion resinicola]